MFTLRGYPRHSLRASSPILASEASLARTRERGAARSRVLARLVSLAQIGELARRLSQTCFLCGFITCAIFLSLAMLTVIYFYGFAQQQVLYIPYSSIKSKNAKLRGSAVEENFRRTLRFERSLRRTRSSEMVCLYLPRKLRESRSDLFSSIFSGTHDGFLPNAQKTLFRQCRVLCILSALKKFMSVRSSQGNLSLFEITKASVLFSGKF